jgi:hypothetical protein
MPVVITDVRFGNEAAALRRCQGTLIHLRRSSATSNHAVMAHSSETESAAITADISIPNNGTLDDLNRRLDRLVYRLSKRSYPL